MSCKSLFKRLDAEGFKPGLDPFEDRIMVQQLLTIYIPVDPRSSGAVADQIHEARIATLQYLAQLEKLLQEEGKL